LTVFGDDAILVPLASASTQPRSNPRVGVYLLSKWLALAAVLIALIACAPKASQVPSIELQSPENGVEVILGQRVLVQSTARDDVSVAKTELWADGRLYEVSRADGPDTLLNLDAIQIWEAATLGEHTLEVKAIDGEGQFSKPATVVVRVVPPQPTPTAAPTPSPTPGFDSSCSPSARFVEDVTVPDDSLFNGGTNFTKTWRLRNDGECQWEPGTQWVFIGGDLLGAQSPVDVELAEPGRIIDISVDMVAPAAPGTYRSYWRLQRPDQEFFGDQAYVRIIVP
jgi:hypothetical protein